MKPTQIPKNPCFSSGPCAKRPGWSLEALKDASLGRSHRAKIGKNKLAEVIHRSKKCWAFPTSTCSALFPPPTPARWKWRCGRCSGERGVDVLAWESFSSGWAADCKNQLQLKDLRIFKADYGKLPDLNQVDWERDVVFAWNGTTSGVRVPNGDWIAAGPRRTHHLRRHVGCLRHGYSVGQARRRHLVLAKGAGRGRRAWHDRAQSQSGARLETFTPPRPLPKIFQMTKGGKLIAGIFQGETINTPSMLCVEDALDGLKWAESIGGLRALSPGRKPT